MPVYEKMCVFSIVTAAAAIIFAVISFILFLSLINKKRAEKQNAARNNLLLSCAAHDIKSPLANIKGFADLLASGKADRQKTEDCLSIISLEAERIAGIAGRLTPLTDSRDIVLGKSSVFGICGMLRYIMASLEHKAQKRGLKILFSFSEENEFFVLADRESIYEAAYNICDNAVKYCSEGGAIKISANEDGGACTVEIKNDSISENSGGKTACSEFFKAGMRGDSAAVSAEQGQGLGLYIAEKIIQAHGQSLTAAIENGVFSLSFSLPLAPPFSES